MNLILLTVPNGIWGWIIFLLTGALIGWIASIFFGSKGGLIKYILIGIAGSYVGGVLGSLIFNETTKFMGYVFSVFGAGLLIIVLRFFKLIK